VKLDREATEVAEALVDKSVVDVVDEGLRLRGQRRRRQGQHREHDQHRNDGDAREMQMQTGHVGSFLVI
jgi:hypothetical protein